MKFKKGIIYYNNPDEIDRLSIEFGIKRKNSHKKLHEVAPEYSRGDSGDDVDILGVKGELIAQAFLVDKKVEHDFVEILTNEVSKTADVFIKEQKIDVKAVKKDLDEFRVNRKAHFQKDITHYWFIKPIGVENNMGVAEYWVIPSVYVSTWEVDYSKKTPFFFFKINEL